jgi:hypothetical protein
MTSSDLSPTPAPRVRPSTVNIAVPLLYVAAGLEVLNAILALATYSDFKSAYAKAYAGTSLAGQAGSATSTVIGGVVVSLVVAAIFVVLAILDGKGNRVGRILTWIFGGLALCCTGSSFALGTLAKTAYDANRKNNPDLPTYDQLQDNINAAVPSWYTPVTIIIGIAVLLAAVTVIILLALPASRDYFRKAAPAQWEPPVPPPPSLSAGEPAAEDPAVPAVGDAAVSSGGDAPEPAVAPVVEDTVPSAADDPAVPLNPPSAPSSPAEPEGPDGRDGRDGSEEPPARPAPPTD